MSDKDTLISMGFAPERIDCELGRFSNAQAELTTGALRATKRSGLQPAMDHLLEHADEPVPEATDEGPEDGLAPDEEAKSIKCSECGKVFRSSATASFHAQRSGHQEFEESTEEIKPLTEEEKKAKLAELREKLALKRAAQGKEDEMTQRANEALRRKAGQDTGRIKEELQAKEIQKDAERKKREKIEDTKARAAIKAQIEADKRERTEKFAREKALRDGAASPAASASPAPTPATKPVTNSSDNPETRLQIRLSVGALVDVAEFVASQNLAYNVDALTFASTFPRKTFARVEMGKTLKANGLTPSAVLMANP